MKPVVLVVAVACLAVFALARAGAATKAVSPDLARTHWAFQAIANPAPPKVQGTAWPRHDLDNFILARLKHVGLTPNPPVSPRALLRRVYFDLLGLPPSFAEMEKFAADPTREHFARLVDDLLARPEYGQRWARHWLDVARYADTTEQSVDGERRIPFAHTHRDYVVDALNADKPFDRFVLEQIAAERLPAATPADLRALGLFGVGRQFFANADGLARRGDDRIDTVTRGFLGLTLACARCHDHKFDPLPTADYYSLYGILDSLQEPLDTPRGWLVYHAPDRWAALLKQSRERDEPFFRLWHQLLALPRENFPVAAKKIIDSGLANHPPAVAAAFSAAPPPTMLAAATTYGALIAQALKADTAEARGHRYDQGELLAFALPDTAPDALGQLYNLKTDPGETTNLYFKHPEVVKELKALLEASKASGRTRAAKP